MDQTYVSFGPYTVNPDTGELWLEGVPISLHQQAGRLLGLLATRAPELVSNEEIRQHLWGDRIVEYDQGIHTTVRKIRTALHDTPAKSEWIQTVPRAGYRMPCESQAVSRFKPNPSNVARAIRWGIVTILFVMVTFVYVNGVSSPLESSVTLEGRTWTGWAEDLRQVFALFDPAPSVRILTRVSDSNIISVRDGDGSLIGRRTLHANESIRSDEVARWTVAQLSQSRIPKNDPPDTIREEFLKAEYLLKSGPENHLATSRAMFERIQEQVPDFAPAVASLAMADLMTGHYLSALEGSQRALKIDRGNALARLVLANVRLWTYWDFSESMSLHRSLLEEFPGWADARVSYAFLLSSQGHHAEAMAQAELALELDPVSPTIHGDLGLIYLMGREYRKAISECQKTLDLASGIWIARDCKASSFLALGDSAAARVEMSAMMRALGVDDSTIVSIEHAETATAIREFWMWTLQWSAPRPDRWYPFFAARAYANLGDKETALATLARALDEHRSNRNRPTPLPRLVGSPMLVALDVDPRMDPLRTDPRFQQMVREIKTGSCCN